MESINRPLYRRRLPCFASNLTTTISPAWSSPMEADEKSYYESAIGSDESAIESDESAIESDDKDDKKFFQRVEKKPTAHESLITLALEKGRATRGGGPEVAKNQCCGNLDVKPSQSTNHRTQTPFGPFLVASSNDLDDAVLQRKLHPRGELLLSTEEITRTLAGPKPITIPALDDARQQSTALSPRTTRRNLLVNELTESLRRGLLHMHASGIKSVAILKKDRPQPYTKRDNWDINAISWHREEAFCGYHNTGW